MSTRQTIVDAIMVQLKTITTANSYHGNAGKNARMLSDVPVTTFPAIRLSDTRAEVVRDEGVPFGFHEHRLTIGITGYDNTMEDVRDLAEDIIAVMWANRVWSGSARWTDLDEHTIEQVHADKKFCMAQLSFTVTYRTALGAY